jgi:hypothetical protein
MTRSLVALGVAAIATPAVAAVNNAIFFTTVPTLDEVGLATLIALVAGVAGWAARQHSKRR